MHLTELYGQYGATSLIKGRALPVILVLQRGKSLNVMQEDYSFPKRGKGFWRLESTPPNWARTASILQFPLQFFQSLWTSHSPLCNLPLRRLFLPLREPGFCFPLHLSLTWNMKTYWKKKLSFFFPENVLGMSLLHTACMWAKGHNSPCNVRWSHITLERAFFGWNRNTQYLQIFALLEVVRYHLAIPIPERKLILREKHLTWIQSVLWRGHGCRKKNPVNLSKASSSIVISVWHSTVWMRARNIYLWFGFTEGRPSVWPSASSKLTTVMICLGKKQGNP